MGGLSAMVLLLFTFTAWAAAPSPFQRQTAEQIQRLSSTSPTVRAGAAEALGYLRAYAAADALAVALRDKTAAVRREAALSLGWCGGRTHVAALLAALADEDWSVRQAAWVALTNITGMEWPFDALAAPSLRTAQAKHWRDWWARTPTDGPPPEVLALLKDTRARPRNWARACAVTASTTYKGPPAVLTDGATHSDYWQTKAVPFPQHCTLDLGEAREIGCVIVHQYGPGFCLTDYALAVSTDGKNFEQVVRAKAKSPPKLAVSFPPCAARFVRVTSHASENKTYPTTFREIEVFTAAPGTGNEMEDSLDLRVERGLRTLGALGGRGSTDAILKIISPCAQREPDTASESTLVQAGLRALGRLRDPAALPTLIEFLDQPYWARFAADALGDSGQEVAVPALIAAYPLYALDLKGKDPERVPADDRPGFEAADRMYETPFEIAAALARLPLTRADYIAALRRIAPLLLANLPSNFDGAMLYEPEAFQPIMAYLLEQAGLRQAACDTAFAALGLPVPPPTVPEQETLADLAQRKHGEVPHAAVWLPALCREPQDVPRLMALLEHESGWVRINAAKALMFLKARAAAAPLAQLLAASKPEAEHGYFGGFMFETKLQGHDEHNDPPPRWREAFVRALGRLGAPAHAPLLESLLTGDRNALEIRHAAAVALDELGTSEALAALRRAEAGHPLHSVRLVAREALWRRGLTVENAGATDRPTQTRAVEATQSNTSPAQTTAVNPGAIVFIKGPNTMPNRFQIDPWRQTYSTTDSGPTYRLGWNLHVLKPASPAGKVTPLTEFKDGYVADCEVSWDGRRVLFARRGGDHDPWWHIWEINADGSNPRQLTRGPYHDVQPAYLGDGRIVFASSRIGVRDEYHGYLATGLTVMNADGSDIHCIGFNLGRDDEPAVLQDGRIAFGRLELFYSRLKTERTLHAVFPDGTQDVTLYGPERRDFWQQVTRQSGEKWWGEGPPRHRVLRLTQPQPFDLDRILCATTGGLTLTGPGRNREVFLPHDKTLAVTTPFPLGDGRVLCAAVDKALSNEEGNLGLYLLDAATGRMQLLYQDPAAASFEPRPLMPRPAPPALIESPQARSHAYTAQFLCASARNTQIGAVQTRGKLVRVIEGMPVVSRHYTHRSQNGEAWKNHVGTFARVLGTVPLAADGSFFLEAPADRLLHLQVLDSDRRVVGNQQIWMYGRPGEKRSCVGCHERPDTTPPALRPGQSFAATMPPVPVLPTGGEFTYRAKAWQKGTLFDETEEQTRTVRAVSLLGRK